MSAELSWPLLLGAAALLLWVPSRGAASRRVAALRLPAREPAAARAVRPPDGPGLPRSRRWLLAGTAASAVGLLVGGAFGIALAIGVAVAVDRLLRARAADDRRAVRKGLSDGLPAASDLLGVCLAAGMPVPGALAAVGEATAGPLGAELRGVAALCRMGADPRRAWADVPAELAALGRVLVRAGESGSAVVPALRALAADGRAAARAASEAAVRRTGVWILAPLGLCFLPAFLCLGVVPLILGIAGDVFG